VNDTDPKRGLDVPRETLARLETFVELLKTENERQNLVSSGSLEGVWTRHIADSLQLVRHAPADAPNWLDLGSGAGFPGLLIPLVHPATVTLVESRRLRIEFLRSAACALGIADRVEILHSRAESAPTREFAVISARAFAPLDRLLALAERFSTEETVWILPKGRNAESELDRVRSSWQGEFRLEPSETDPDARIIVARGVRRRARRP